LEVLEDEYPIMLVNGLDVARTVLAMARDAGQLELRRFLEAIDLQGADAVHSKRPEDILRE
jgi:hypothetical protein